MIEVKKSNIHNNGVFSLTDIPAYTKVTKFPCHYEIKGKTILGLTQEDTKRDKDEIMDMFYRYGLTIDNEHCIIGDKDKFTPEECGHIINDACNINFPDRDKITKTQMKKLLMKYYADCLNKCNCFVEGRDILTIRNINKGEELTICYGSKYWFLNHFGYDEETKKLYESVMKKINHPLINKMK